MQPIFARGNSRTLQRLKALRQEAQTDSATRVVLRLQAITLSVQGLQERNADREPAPISAPSFVTVCYRRSIDCVIRLPES